MSIHSKLEKLITHRDRGDLTQAEFEKAKTLLLSEDCSGTPPLGKARLDKGRPAAGIPGFSLAAGVFAGNLLIISITSGDVGKGLAVGAMAAVLVVAFSFVARALKSG